MGNELTGTSGFYSYSTTTKKDGIFIWGDGKELTVQG